MSALGLERVLGRIRIARSPDCSKEVLTGFLAAMAEPGSVIYTGHWPGDNGLAGAGFQHWPTNTSANGDPAHSASRGVMGILLSTCSQTGAESRAPQRGASRAQMFSSSWTVSGQRRIWPPKLSAPAEKTRAPAGVS